MHQSPGEGRIEKALNRVRVLVLGAGRIGTHLLRYLSHDEQNKLTVVEKSRLRCKEVSNEFDASIINGDGSSPRVLKVADLSNVDLLILATDNDEVNMTAAKFAKKDFAVPRVFAVANSSKNKSRMKESGADVVVCPVDLALQDLENMFSENRSSTLLYRPEIDLKIVETIVPLNARMIGKRLSELELPQKVNISLICRNGGYMQPDPSIELRSDDRVFLIGEEKAVNQTIDMLRSKEEA